MAYEFKKLSDVEIVAEPTESANVLIEENGVIKKAPKTAIGGGGEWDAVIEWKDTDDERSLTLVFGDYNAVYNKIMVDGEIPNIMIKTATQYGWLAYGAEKARMITVVVNPDNSSDHYITFERPETCMNTGDAEYFIAWHPDGVIEHY